MPEYQLTLSPDYVSDWTYVEAIRELFQNALDNEKLNPENKMMIEYDGSSVLRIGNKTSVLKLDTLLLGMSTKRDNADTIDQHGEGYKVALMVLLREGKKITFYNYGAREVWTTRLIKSRKYNGALIPSITVVKKSPFKSVPSHDLIIEVEGVSAEDYAHVCESNLHLQDNLSTIDIDDGDSKILLDKSKKGRMYVNGLYISTNKDFKYGYSFAPSVVKLDRDRRLIDSFDLKWNTSSLWGKTEGHEDKIVELINSNAQDTQYLANVGSFSGGKKQLLADNLMDTLEEEYGEDIVLVTSTEELKYASSEKPDANIVIVSSNVKAIAENATRSRVFVKKSRDALLMEWFEGVENKLTDEEAENFRSIMLP